MTFEELKKLGGYNTNMKFVDYIKRGNTIIPVDPEQKAQMWKLNDDYYWIENENIIQKMHNSTKRPTLDDELNRIKDLKHKGLYSNK